MLKIIHCLKSGMLPALFFSDFGQCAGAASGYSSGTWPEGMGLV
ncbi:hypothetical protein [Edwardsiella hoshinae]|nr:hypothetical protein [Edwardsiella hoshinae]